MGKNRGGERFFNVPLNRLICPADWQQWMKKVGNVTMVTR
jgi:hypothetical protein